MIQFEASLAAGGQSTTAAMNATPSIRTAVVERGRRFRGVQLGVAGEAAAVYDINQTANHDLRS